MLFNGAHSETAHTHMAPTPLTHMQFVPGPHSAHTVYLSVLPKKGKTLKSELTGRIITLFERIFKQCERSIGDKKHVWDGLLQEFKNYYFCFFYPI